MKLGEIIFRYRKEHHLSMDNFAQRSGLSKATISLLESGLNPKTKKPLTPTIDTIAKCSKAMGIDVRLLLAQLDDETIDYTSELFGDNPYVSIQGTNEDYEDIRDMKAILDFQKHQQEQLRNHLFDGFMQAPKETQIAIAHLLNLQSLIPIIEDMNDGE